MRDMRFSAGGGSCFPRHGRKMRPMQFPDISPAAGQPLADAGIFAGGGDFVFPVQSLSHRQRRIPGQRPGRFQIRGGAGVPLAPIRTLKSSVGNRNPKLRQVGSAIKSDSPDPSRRLGFRDRRGTCARWRECNRSR